MNKEVVLMLSELRSQIDDTIRRVEKESAAESKEIMSTLKDCGLIEVSDWLILPQDFLEWCYRLEYLETEDEEINIGGRSCIAHKYVSKTNLINLNKNGSVTVHPSLLYVYLNNGRN